MSQGWRLEHFAQAAEMIDQVEAMLDQVRNISAPLYPVQTWLTQSRLHYQLGKFEQSYRYAQRCWDFLEERQTAAMRSLVLVRLGYATLHQQRYGEAADAFVQAVRYQEEAHANELYLEARIALAYIALQQGGSAKTQAEFGAAATWFVQQECFDACEEPVEMLLLAYEVWQACGEVERAQQIAERGAHLLQKRVANIHSSENQQSYLANFSSHRQIQWLAAA